MRSLTPPGEWRLTMTMFARRFQRDQTPTVEALQRQLHIAAAAVERADEHQLALQFRQLADDLRGGADRALLAEN